MTTPAQTDPLLVVEDVSKSYAGIEVLHAVGFTIEPGEVLGLVGENGAGKSTVLSLISGMNTPTSGRVVYRGRPLPSGWSPREARAAGIGSVHQELSLTPHQTVAENVFLGDWPTTGGVARPRDLEKAAQPFLDRVGLTVSPRALVRELTLGEMQLVELAKALVADPQLLILDEVTSALDDAQVQQVFAVIREIRDAGGTVVVVTHRMSELFAVCDRLTVLKDGAYVDTVRTDRTDEAALVQLMLGRELSEVFPAKAPVADEAPEPLLTLRGVQVPGVVEDLDLDIAPGRILGLGGLQGQGQSEVLRCLFGLQPHRGEIAMSGRRLRLSSPAGAIRHRIIYVPEDRKTEGVDVRMTVAENLQLPNVSALAPARRLGTVRRRAARDLVAQLIGRLQIKARPSQEVRRLSGGNQQKVALAKWLPQDPHVLLLAEPTRGIDVGTKHEIYRLLRDFADRGLAVVITSGDTMELVGLCDEIAVMYEGRIIDRLTGSRISEEELVHASVTGGKGVAHADHR